MKKVLLICCFGLLLLAGCSKDKDVDVHRYTFRGENELWEAEYKVDGIVTFYTNERGSLKADTKSHQLLAISYKGKIQDLENVKFTKFSYQTNTFGGNQTSSYEEGDYEINSKTFKILNGGGSMPAEDEIITVTIQIDDDIQTLELSTKKKGFETY